MPVPAPVPTPASTPAPAPSAAPRRERQGRKGGGTPYRLFRTEVARKRALTPGMVRLTLTGPELDGFMNGGLDQRIKFLLPQPGQSAPVLPEPDESDGGDGLGWWHAWREMPLDVRPVMRTYTVRAARPEQREIDVDVALHVVGVAAEWVAAATPGAPLGVVGPAAADAGGVEFALPSDADWVLLWGDQTALPAIACILAELPAGLPVLALIGVPDAGERQPLPSAADVRLHWTHGTAPTLPADLPPGRGYAWLAGEAGRVQSLRRELLAERGFTRDAVAFMGYWKHGEAGA